MLKITSCRTPAREPPLRAGQAVWLVLLGRRAAGPVGCEAGDRSAGPYAIIAIFREVTFIDEAGTTSVRPQMRRAGVTARTRFA